MAVAQLTTVFLFMSVAMSARVEVFEGCSKVQEGCLKSTEKCLDGDLSEYYECEPGWPWTGKLEDGYWMTRYGEVKKCYDYTGDPGNPHPDGSKSVLKCTKCSSGAPGDCQEAICKPGYASFVSQMTDGDYPFAGPGGDWGSGLRGICVGFECVLPRTAPAGYVIDGMSCSNRRNGAQHEPDSWAARETLPGSGILFRKPMVCETVPKCAAGYHAFHGTTGCPGADASLETCTFSFEDKVATWTSGGVENTVWDFFCPAEGAELQLGGCEKIPPECEGKNSCPASVLQKFHLKEKDFDVCGNSCAKTLELHGRAACDQPWSAICKGWAVVGYRPPTGWLRSDQLNQSAPKEYRFPIKELCPDECSSSPGKPVTLAADPGDDNWARHSCHAMLLVPVLVISLWWSSMA